MGGGSYSDATMRTLSSVNSTKHVDDIFSTSLKSEMSPKDLKFRESRDNAFHPQAVPIIIALDVTGSMGSIPERLCKEKLPKLMEVLLKHNVADPAILFLCIGDHYSDRAPLQVGQFEGDAEGLNKWLTSVYLECGGGGQHMESYPLAWLVAGRHTITDHMEKRNRKGYLFTIGDESFHDKVESDWLKTYMGYAEAEDISATALLAEAQRMYEVFHIHANNGSYHNSALVLDPWKKALSERLLVVEDDKDIAEVIATTISVMEGAKLEDVVKDFDAATSDVVTKALAVVSTSVSTLRSESGVTTL